MAETMVERVAEAIKRHHGSPHYEDTARAAIEALREPTSAMVAAAWGEPADVNHIWRTMVDAALAETGKE